MLRYCLISMLVIGIYAANSASVTWSNNNTLYKAGIISVITSSATKSGSASANYLSPFAVTPKLVVGICDINAAAGNQVQINYPSNTSRSTTGFTMNFGIGATTTMNVLKYSFLAIVSTNSNFDTFIDGVFSFLVGSTQMAKINAGSGDRSASKAINFTFWTGVSMNMSNEIKVIMYIQGINMFRNGGDFNVKLWGVFLNSSFYTLIANVSDLTTVTEIRFSRIFYDRTILQMSQMDFVDSSALEGLTSDWSTFSLTLKYYTEDNFHIGMSAIAYISTQPLRFLYSKTLLSCTGTMNFNQLTLSYWSYRKRICPSGYPIFDVNTDLCWDLDCGGYKYVNTTRQTCQDCYYTCYSCLEASPNSCQTCAPTDFRTKSGINCLCNSGYYDAGVALCQQCTIFGCQTCNSATVCTFCNATNSQLTSGSCPCDPGYYPNTGSGNCQLCTMTGCLQCSSLAVCTQCDTSNNFTLSSGQCTCITNHYLSGSLCKPCSFFMWQCTACSSSSICTACTGNNVTLQGTSCSCQPGTANESGICIACAGTGCLVCSPSTVCSQCDTTSFFTLSGSTCQCMPGYTYVVATTSCQPCNNTLVGCQLCSSTAVCSQCNATGSFITDPSDSTKCICAPGQFSNGGVCQPCTMTGCLECTSASVCTVCDSGSNFVLNAPNCGCSSAYYLAGVTCNSCSSAITYCLTCTSITSCSSCDGGRTFSLGACSCPSGTFPNGVNCDSCAAGCLLCSSLSTCTQCETVSHFVLSGSVCQCVTGYSLVGAVCVQCPLGCLTCSSSTVCTTCDTANNFVSDGSNGCQCTTGYALNGGSCQLCSVTLPGCVQCSSTTICTSCNPAVINLALSLGTCSCTGNNTYNATSNLCQLCLTCCTSSEYLNMALNIPYGQCSLCTSIFTSQCLTCSATACLTCAPTYFVNSSIQDCSSCQTIMSGCLDCTSSTACTSCDGTAHYQLSGSNCVCMTTYIQSGTQCLLCSSFIDGCSTCSSTAVCTVCDGSTHFVADPLDNTKCACTAGYYLQSPSCIACSLTGCLECTSVSVCTVCDTVDHFIQSGNNCVCAVGYFASGASCVTCGTGILGCTACTSLTSCTTCDNTLHFVLDGLGGCKCDDTKNYTLTGSTCVCQTGYTEVGAACYPCQNYIPGCNQCTSTTVCTSCVSPFQLSGSTCVCQPGYFQSGSVCVACSLTGCLECTSASTCTVCNSGTFFTLTSPNCSCQSGYYLSVSSCLTCRSGFLGCSTCTPSTCQTCNTTDHFEMMMGVCVCSDGYFPDVTTNPIVCIPCYTGCLICNTNSDCMTCDTAGHFELSGVGCVCQAGYFLSMGVCQPCSPTYNWCSECTPSVCTACISPTVLQTGTCVCPVGQYNDTTVCQQCSSQFYGCLECTLGSCTVCDTTLHLQLSGSSCACISGYVANPIVCSTCPSLINGCLTCSAINVCTSCNTAAHYVLSASLCICQTGYYLDSVSQTCVACPMVGCTACTSATVCTACSSTNNFTLVGSTCQCILDYIVLSGVCVDCMGACTCHGYQWYNGVVGGFCAPYCGDGITITPTEHCDDGNLNNGDGCSIMCQPQANYTCILSGDISSCSYNQPMTIALDEIIKIPQSNQLKFKFNIGPILPQLQSIDFSQIITTNQTLNNLKYHYNNGTVQLTFDYNDTIQSQSVQFSFNPNFNGMFFATPPSNVVVQVLPNNNLPAIYYEQQTYGQVETINQTYYGLTYASYGILAIGLLTDKVIGIELFGVLQLAHLVIADLTYVMPQLSPLMNLSIVNGYNPSLTENKGQLPERVKAIGYSAEFINNYSAMFGLVIGEMMIAGILFLVGRLSGIEKATVIGRRLLKQYLLMLVLFNSYNCAFSLGLQQQYGQPTIINLVLCCLAPVLPIAMIVLLYFSNKEDFAQFISHYRSDFNSQSYFVLTIINRMLIGYFMSRYNEVEQFTIVNVFLGILFTLYIISNKPYKKTYHNYRAGLHQITCLWILGVAMYYRSMNSTTSIDVASKIAYPAWIELALICSCVLSSFASLAYQLFRKYIKPLFGKKQVAEPVPPARKSSGLGNTSITNNQSAEFIIETYPSDNI